MASKGKTARLWTRDQLKLGFHLYCQLPFGRLHQRNPEIVALASLIGRTPSALAMKLCNFASLDPSITGSGRQALGNASALDRDIWDAFHADWEALAVECAELRSKLEVAAARPTAEVEELAEGIPEADYTGETRTTIVTQRIKQDFFRRAVLASYRGRCCMSGLSEPRLLIASHIVPWSKDPKNRLNPSNGLCLSSIHDRAFDQGLMTLSDDLKVIVSGELRYSKDPFISAVLAPLHKEQIALPERFAPKAEFLAHHRDAIFIDNKKGQVE